MFIIFQLIIFWNFDFFIIFTLSYYEYDKVYFCTLRMGICILLSFHEFIMKNQSLFWAQIFGHLTQHPPQTFILPLTTSRKMVALSWGLQNHISKISKSLSYWSLSYFWFFRIFIILHFIIFAKKTKSLSYALYHIGIWIKVTFYHIFSIFEIW